MACEDAEHTYESLIQSFEYFGGVTNEVLVDYVARHIIVFYALHDFVPPGCRRTAAVEARRRSGRIMFKANCGFPPINVPLRKVLVLVLS
jgi:hypothetical protein